MMVRDEGNAGTKGGEVCIFSKHLAGFSVDELGDIASEAGFDGVDLAVRPGGHVEPGRVETDLPRAVEAIRRAGCSVPMIVTAVTEAGDPAARRIVETAAGLGIGFYRLGYWRYGRDAGVRSVFPVLRPKMERLAELNERCGIHGAYQNHAGTFVGSPVWDLARLLEGLDTRYIGCQYDVRHAVVEGGNTWELGLELLGDAVRCAVVKDFKWTGTEVGGKIENLPLGQGLVDFRAFFTRLKSMGFRGPLSMHYEYPLPGERGEIRAKADRQRALIPVLRRDVERLREYLDD